MIFIIVGLYTSFVIYEVQRLKKLNLKKELWVFSVFTFFAFVIAMLQAQGVKIPNPHEVSKSLTYAIMGFAIKFFQV